MRDLDAKYMVENKSDYIGKTCIHDDYSREILLDIYLDYEINPDGFLWFKMENGRAYGGTEEIVSVCDYEKITSVHMRYCGGFDILKGV